MGYLCVYSRPRQPIHMLGGGIYGQKLSLSICAFFLSAPRKGGSVAKQGKPLAPGEAYKGRRADVAVLNCTVPRETTALIKAYSGGGKKIGTFIALLFQDYHSKQLEE